MFTSICIKMPLIFLRSQPLGSLLQLAIKQLLCGEFKVQMQYSMNIGTQCKCCTHVKKPTSPFKRYWWVESFDVLKKKIVLYLTNRLSACSTLISPFFTLLIKLILSSSLMVVISHAINSEEGLLFDFLLVLFPKIPRFNLGLLPIFSSSLEKSLWRKQKITE